jgi:diguanylate cyclase (GGDEF)-like protein
MSVRDNGLRRRADHSELSRWIVIAVVLCGTAFLAVLGLDAVPAAIGWAFSHGGELRPSTSPFLLSLALVALASRRSIELRHSSLERVKFEERLRELAYQDEVTGLLNRRGFTEKLAGIDRADDVTLILLDVDHFKRVNDIYGHSAGDALLLTISQRLRYAAPDGAVCARLGGDEFAVLLTRDHAQVGTASQTAAKIIEKLNKAILLDTTTVQVGASLGLSTLEPTDERTMSLLRRSDIAMYEAKRLGRNRYVWFDAQMEQKLQNRSLLEAEMRSGIRTKQFIPYFQPMLDLVSGEVKGFEVLARWAHPERGIVEPDEFIAVAEATGMISELSFGVMHTALQEALSWPNHITIAVNVSPVQFKDPLLAQRIVKLLQETGFPPHRLELEVSERAILNDRDLALATVASLKNFGVRMSLDDFGIGYASLSQLQDLPFDRIKIDRNFVSSLLEDRRSNAIVHAIAALGRSLQLPITAEGVESKEVQTRLKELGCSHAQGWLFGRAVPAAAVSHAFRMNRPGVLSAHPNGLCDRRSSDWLDQADRGAQ